jgi:hypothetical protein
MIFWVLSQSIMVNQGNAGILVFGKMNPIHWSNWASLDLLKGVGG